MILDNIQYHNCILLSWNNLLLGAHDLISALVSKWDILTFS